MEHDSKLSDEVGIVTSRWLRVLVTVTSIGDGYEYMVVTSIGDGYEYIITSI